MLVLISSDKDIPDESVLVEQLLERFPHFRFHLRKPSWRSAEKINFVRTIDAKYHDRISVHSRTPLPQLPENTGWHLSGSHTMSNGAKSTSMHKLKQLTDGASRFDYFFCSPVFPSISKRHHRPKEQWNLDGQEEHIINKSVGLGGMDARTMKRAVQLGFKHFAVLGAVWKSEDPIKAFQEIYKACPNIDPIA